jgi:hypothetical protein
MMKARWLIVLGIVALIVVPVVADSGAAHKVKQTPPVKMGTSGGSVSDSSRLYCCGGTLGSLVRYDGVLSILSNNHVLARSGVAVTGEDTIQPGLIDVGCSKTTSNIIGDFAGNKVPLGSGNVDAAIATARAGMVDATGAIIDVGVPCSGTQTPTVGLAVAKSGRTTGYTTGSIQSVNTSVSVGYQKGCGTGKQFTVSYTNQVVITPGTFSAGGDSGSLIVSNDGSPNPVALLYAGSTSQTIGNPIQAVVSAFQAGGHTFSFVGNTCAVAASSTSAAGLDLSLAEVDFARTVKERYEPDLFALPGVIGVGVGVDELDATRAAIVVYLSTDVSAHPQPGRVPADLGGVKIRVIPTDPFIAR